MLKLFFSSPVQIGIGIDEVIVRHQKRTGKFYSSSTVTKSSVNNSQPWDTQLRALLTENKIRNRTCYVHLSNDFVRHFIVKPAKNTLSLRDCRDVAYARFQTLFGEKHEDWLIQGDWNQQYPFFACAIPKSLLHQLARLTTEFKLRVLNTTPQLASVWNAHRKALSASDLLIVIDKNLLQIICIQQHGIGDIRMIPFFDTHEVQHNWLEQQIRIESLRLGLGEIKKIHLVGNLPIAWKNSSVGIIDLTTKNTIPQATSILHYVIGYERK